MDALTFSCSSPLSNSPIAEATSYKSGSEHYYALFLVGAVLFTFTFVLNLVSEIVLTKMRQKLRM